MQSIHLKMEVKKWNNPKKKKIKKGETEEGK